MTAINVLSKNTKNVISFHLKINIFTAVKYCCILHGRVFVMILPVSEVIKRYLNQLKLSTSGRIFQQYWEIGRTDGKLLLKIKSFNIIIKERK